MSRVLDRYVYREMLPVILLGIGLFTFLHVMDRIQDFTNMALTGAPIHLVVRMWLLLLLSFLSHTLPMALLLAVVMAAGRLASDLEAVALAAAGVSPLRLFRPFFVVALAVALVTAALTFWINPWGHGVFFRYLAEVRQHAAMPLIQERTFTRLGDLAIYAQDAALGTSELGGLLISDEREPPVLRILTAPRGHLIGDPERQRTVLRLVDGAIHESRPGTAGWYRVTSFSRYDIGLDVGAQVAAARQQHRPDRDLSMWDLISNTRALEWTRGLEKAEMFVLAMHKRLAFPFGPLVFAMVGFPLGLRLRRGGRAVAVVGAITLLLVYYLLQETLGGIRALRPWGAGRWGPVIMFGLLGMLLLHFTAHPAPARWRRGAARLLELLPARVSLAWLAARGAFPARTAGRWTWTAHRAGSLVDRYLLRQFLVNLAYGLAAAAAIFVVVDLLETLGGFMRTRPPLSAVLEHYAYRVPAALHQALPIVVLVATVFLFMELNRHHELTALKAAGLSVHRLSLPVLLLAACLSAGAFVFQETALPALNARGDEVDRVKIRGEPPRELRAVSHVWYRRSDSEFVRIERLDRARQQVSGVTLVEVDPDFRVARQLDVERLLWAPDGWELGPGVLRELGPDRTIRTRQLPRPPLPLPESFETFGTVPTAPAAMTSLELRAYMRELRERGHQVGTWVLHLHARLSFPLMGFVLALVGIAASAPWTRGGRLVGAAIAVGLAVGYWVVNSVALSFGRADLLPPVLAAWTANIVFGGVGLALFLRIRT